ncbi:unnamed protein product, partial [Scytosiphon promiscuus]
EEQDRIAHAVIDTDDVAWILTSLDVASGQRTPPSPPPDQEPERSATTPAPSRGSNGRPQEEQEPAAQWAAVAVAAVNTATAGAARTCSSSGGGSAGGAGKGDDVSPSPLASRASPPLPPLPLRLVGGVDISFVKGSEQNACATLVVLEFPSLETVYEAYERVTMHHPYVSGFLAFREVKYPLR